jgi:hypothetical protein
MDKEVTEDVYQMGFVIFNFDRDGKEADFQFLYDLARKLGVEYEQQDVQFVGKPAIDDLTRKYFTKLREYGKRFSYLTGDDKDKDVSECVVYINPAPNSIMEMHARYLNNEFTFKIL